jgi:outer membrane biosynthesis protein TonB
MAKKNANNAIDFSRLLAVKDNLPSLASLPGALEVAPDVEMSKEQSAPAPTGTLLEFPAREQSAEAPTTLPASPASTVPSSPAAFSSPTEDVGTTEPETVVLRIGLSRPLHDRIRACAALEGQTPAHLARQLLSSRTPAFSRATPMVALAKEARESFPASAARMRIEVRMQVPLDIDLHRRLHQLAALRAQTLVACISDLFEASIPAM